MRKLLLAALLLLPIGAHAQAQPAQIVNCIQSPAQPCNTNAQVGNATDGDHAWLAFGKANANAKYIAYGGPIFPAENSGNCLWNASGDVGPCINQAIAAAATAGGGTVLLPASSLGSYFGLATQIVQSTNGVHLVGTSVGAPRLASPNSYFVSTTRLLWTGAANATMAVIAPVGNVELISADVRGIVFDCNSVAAICVDISQVAQSTFDIGAAEPGSIGILYETIAAVTNGVGTQENDIWAKCRSTSVSLAPTCIQIDRGVGAGPGAGGNTSYNRFHQIQVTYNLGDGIVLGAQDNNLIEEIRTSAVGSGTGRPVVFANSTYVSPNGVAVRGITSPSETKILHTGSQISVLGFQTGSSITAAGGNTGTAAVATTTISTNATSANGSGTLSFASTTGVAVGEVVNCAGGISSGVAPNDQVVTVNSTTVGLLQNTVSAVASGLSCVFGYSVTNSAKAGTYTITAASSSTFNITAPSGGHSQSGIAYSGGFVSFTDLLLPLTGTPVTGDILTLVVPSPATGLDIGGVDNSNNIPLAFFENGASGQTGYVDQPIEYEFHPSGGIAICNVFYSQQCVQPTGAGGITIGSGAATGQGAVAIGPGTTASGLGAVATGHNSTASNNYSFTTGNGNTASGASSNVGGVNATDRGRFATACRGTNELAVLGDSQYCDQVLNGTGASTSAIRLTADGNAAGSANCVNIPNNSAYAISLNVLAFDHDTVTKSSVWNGWTGLMTRGTNAASTALTMNATPTPIQNGGFAPTISATADTTLGCLNLSITPPGGNTDTINIVAKVSTPVEVQ